MDGIENLLLLMLLEEGEQKSGCMARWPTHGDRGRIYLRPGRKYLVRLDISQGLDALLFRLIGFF